MISKVQCLFNTEIFTTEGIGGEKGGSENFKAKHTEPLTQEITRPLYNISTTGVVHKIMIAVRMAIH